MHFFSLNIFFLDSQMGVKFSFCLSLQLRENGFPGDMALTPRETLQLYDVIAQHWPDKAALEVGESSILRLFFHIMHRLTLS